MKSYKSIDIGQYKIDIMWPKQNIWAIVDPNSLWVFGPRLLRVQADCDKRFSIGLHGGSSVWGVYQEIEGMENSG